MGQFLNIAFEILSQEGKPLRPRDIIDLAKDRGYLDFSGGLTPYQTLKARVSEDIRNKRENSRFKRIGKGVFALREFEKMEYLAKPFEKIIKEKEDVLVFKTELFEQIGRFNGIISSKREITKYLKILLHPSNTIFIPRIKAETNINYKQLLSYVIVKKNNQILRFVRGVYSNAHNMLKGRMCIGFGGHVQSIDRDLFAIENDNGYLNSVKRELREELNLSDQNINNNLKLIGLLNDDSSLVGNVHFALIHMLDLDNCEINEISKLKGEKSINQLTLVNVSNLGDGFENYEFWSKLCIKQFYKNEVKIKCTIHRVKNYSLSKHPDIIVLVGAIGSGKTEAAKILAKSFSYKMISSGRILQEIMQVPNMETIGRSAFQNLANNFIKEDDGPNLLANKIFELITGRPYNRFVIDGIRNIRTLELLKEKLGKDITLIYVDSTIDNCYKFFSRREGIIDEYDFFKYLNHPVESEINKLISRANIVFYNHGSKTSFEKEITNFFKNTLK